MLQFLKEIREVNNCLHNIKLRCSMSEPLYRINIASYENSIHSILTIKKK